MILAILLSIGWMTAWLVVVSMYDDPPASPVLECLWSYLDRHPQHEDGILSFSVALFLFLPVIAFFVIGFTLQPL